MSQKGNERKPIQFILNIFQIDICIKSVNFSMPIQVFSYLKLFKQNFSHGRGTFLRMAHCPKKALYFFCLCNHANDSSALMKRGGRWIVLELYCIHNLCYFCIIHLLFAASAQSPYPKTKSRLCTFDRCWVLPAAIYIYARLCDKEKYCSVLFCLKHRLRHVLLYPLLL